MEEYGKNLLIIFSLVVVHIVIPYMAIRFGWNTAFWLVYIIAEILILPALSGFVTNFVIYPQLQKYKK